MSLMRGDVAGGAVMDGLAKAGESSGGEADNCDPRRLGGAASEAAGICWIELRDELELREMDGRSDASDPRSWRIAR